MIKTFITTAIALATCATTTAIPAKKMWRSILLPDGTRTEAVFVGNERCHYYLTRDGYAYTPLNDISDNEPMRLLKAEEMRMATTTFGRGLRRLTPRASSANSAEFRGKKKGLVVLAYFSDKSFAQNDSSIVSFYDKVLNKESYSENGAPGSVHDYFKDMSRGVFDLTFDIVGPVRVSKSATYYGGPSALYGGTDHAGEFITDALKKADSQFSINWSDYDWNNDGEVDQVFVLYAGYGQATGGPTGTIWPHAWTLDEAAQNNDGDGGFSLGGVYINRYACSNELYSNSGRVKMGHGTFCHEFSHCMGLPDMYDTNYGSTPTMGTWDLMASGSYNGPKGLGWSPAPWTSWERWQAGWLTPTELQPGDTITDMKGLEDDDAQAYIIYNDAHPDEYYLLENHTMKKWDAYAPESGLLILHVDYDKELFDNNIVNTRGTFTPEEGYSGYFTNDHPRMAPFSKVRSISGSTYYYTYPMQAPRGVIDSLTNTSNPAATLYNEQTDGTLLMSKPLKNISKDSATGNISFVFMPKEGNTTMITENMVLPYRDEDQVPVYNLAGECVGKMSDIRSHKLSAGIYVTANGKKTIVR